MASCAANEPGLDGDGNGNSDAEVKGYLSVNLVTTGAPRSRDDVSTPSNNGQYEYGTAEENYVNEVRFYFFYSNEGQTGLPCPIRKNPAYTPPVDGGTENPPVDGNGELEYFSYYDWSPTYADNQGQVGVGGTQLQDPENSGKLPGGTIEKVLTAMIVLTSKPAYAPEQIVAVINPTPAIKNLQNPTLAELRSANMVANYKDGLIDQNFVMSSSVYIDKEEGNDLQGVIIAQNITKDNLQATQPLAQDHPLTVYVERVLARYDHNFAPSSPDENLEAITFNENQDNEYTIYPTGFYFTSEDLDQTPDGTQEPEYNKTPIYAKFLGWAITSTPNKSNLIKNITTAWGGADDLFQTINEPWYIPGYHRSFWAMNPQLTASAENPDDNYIWYNYNELIGAATPDQGECFNMKTKRGYMQENANPYSTTGEAANPEHPTKVIYAAQLVEEDGVTPVTVAEWNGVYFTLDGLKALAATMMQMYYLKPGTGTAEVPAEYVPISADQITFMTRRAYLGKSTAIFSEPGSYYVYPTLTSSTDPEKNNETDNAASLKWYHHANDGTDNYTEIKGSLNTYMYDTFGYSKVWNNGMTYYYFEINHLGAEEAPGYYGVVRNHIYNASVNKLSGLGTPVWDPKEDIYPEKPSPEGNNLSAEVKVLMWRMVSQDVEFDW